MGLKTTIPIRGEGSTVGTGWTTIAEYSLLQDCSFEIADIFLIGKTSNGVVGQTAYCKALHRGKRVSGNISLVGAPVYLVTFSTGSESPLSTCAMQIIINGIFPEFPRIELQVWGVLSRNIDWYGGFTIVMH